MASNKPSINKIVQAYNLLVRHIDDDARTGDALRAYGGAIRSAKGALVEGIAKNIIEIAWVNIGGKMHRLSFEKQPILVPIRQSYIDQIKDAEIKAYIQKNIRNYVYKFKTDVHVNIDRKLIAGVECKAYAENAMLKRISIYNLFF